MTLGFIRPQPRIRRFDTVSGLFGLVVGGFFATRIAHAQPSGEQITQGAATFNRNGNLTTITAANNTIIRYNSFDIPTNQTVRFIQPSETSRVLNWVNGGLPTHIDGSLFANGHVYLANAAGVYFGANSYVNVGALYVAGGSISSDDFLQGSNRFTHLSGEVRNDGVIQASTVALMGKIVANHGAIHAPDGLVTLAAGDEVYLAAPGSAIVVAAPQDHPAPVKVGVENTGQIDVGKGQAALLAAGDLYSLAISQSGVVRGSHIIVDGGAKGAVQVSGTLDASTAAGSAAKGGEVHVLGGEVALTSTAHLDASGSIGGGTLLVGGDFQGKNPEFSNATNTSVEKGATLVADALDHGDGGKVIVWSDANTTFAGQLSARGGSQSGDGGFAEVSGKALLSFTGRVDLRSAFGAVGTLLLDPKAIDISSPPSNGSNPSDPFPSTGSPRLVGFAVSAGGVSSFDPADIAAALDGGDVILQASNTLTVNSAIDASANTGVGSLTFQSGKSIFIKANITLKGSFTATANDSGASVNHLTDSATAVITMDPSTTISSTTGGDLSFSISAPAAAPHDVIGALTINSLATTGSGAITLSNPGGDIVVNGSLSSSSGAFTANTAVGAYTQNTGSHLSAGSILISAPDVVIQTGSDLTATGTLTFSPAQATETVGLGVTTENFNLDAGELGRLFAATVVIGNTNGTGAFNAGILDLSASDYNLTLQGTSSSLNATGDVTLKAGKTLTLNLGGALQFGGALTTGSLDLSAAGVVTVSGTLTATSLTASTGSNRLTLNGGGSTITNAVTINGGGLTLGNDDTDSFTFNGGLTSTTGSNLFRGTVATSNDDIALGSLSPTGALTVNAGSARFSTTGLLTSTASVSVTATGGITFGGDVSTVGLTTSGAITFSGSGARQLNAGTGTLSLGAVTAGLHDLTLTGDTLALNGALTGTGSLTLAPYSAGVAIGIGDGAPGSFQLSTSAVAAIGIGGFSALNIGATNSGAVALASGLTFHNPLTLRGGTLSLAGSVASTASIDLFNAVSLTGHSSFDVSANTLHFRSTINGSYDLSLQAGTLSLDDTVGSVAAPLGILTLTGTSSVNVGGDIAATSLTLNNPTSLIGSRTLSADTLNLNAALSGSGLLTLQPISTNRAINLGSGSGGLDLSAIELDRLSNGFAGITIGRVGDTGPVTLTTTVTPITFQDPLTLRGGPLSLSGSFIGANDASIDVYNAVTLTGASTWAINVNTSALTFHSTVDGNRSLALTGGTITFSSAVGNTDPLSGLSLTSLSSSVSQNAPWKTNNLSIATPGDIALGNAGNAFTGITSIAGSNTGKTTVSLASTTASTVAITTVNGALEFDNLSLLAMSSVFSATSKGNITQTSSGTVGVNGTATFTLSTAGSDLLLGNSGNVFQNTAPPVIPVVPSLIIAGFPRDIALANSASTASIPASFPLVGLRNVTLDFSQASISLPTMTVTGTLNVTSGGNILGGISSVTVQGAGTSSLVAAGSITLPTFTVANDVTITAGSSITSANIQNLNGSTTLAASTTSDIFLTNPSNSLGHVTLGPARDVRLRTSGAITLGQAPSQSLRNILVQTNGGFQITQSNSLHVTGFAYFVATSGSLSSVLLDDSDNDFGTVIVGSSDSVIIVDANSLVFGRETALGIVPVTATFGSLDLKTNNGSLTQVASAGSTLIDDVSISYTPTVSVIGLSTFNATGGGITFNNASNDFQGAVTFHANGAVTLNDLNTLTVGPSSSGSNLALTAANLVSTGDLTATGGATLQGTIGLAGNLAANGITLTGNTTLSKAGTQLLDAGTGALLATGSVTKTGSGNLTLQGATLTFNGSVTSAVGLVDFNGSTSLAGDLSAVGLTLDAITLNGAGAQTLDATTGAFSISGDLTKAVGSLTLKGAGGITLGGNTSAKGLTLSNNTVFSSASAQLLDAGSTGALSVTGNLTKALGRLTLLGGGGVSVSGDISAQGVTLANATTFSGSNAQTMDAGSGTMSVAGDLIKTIGNLSLLTPSDLTLTGAAAQALRANAGSLAITGSVSKTTGPLTLFGSGGVTLTGDVSAVGLTLSNAVTLSGAAAQNLSAGTGALSFGGPISKANGDLTLAGQGNITLPTSLTVSNGSLLATDPVSAASTLSLTVAHDVTLTHPNNHFGGAVTLPSSQNATLRSFDSLTLGTSTLSGSLTLSTSGPITQTLGSTLTVSGLTTINAGAAFDVTLANAGNRLSDLLIGSARNATLTDSSGALRFGAGSSAVAGALSLTLTGVGSLSQNAASTLVVTGLTTLNVGAANDVELNNQGNDFSRLLVTSAHDVTLADTNGLTFAAGTSTISGNLALTFSGIGALSQEAASTLLVSGLTTLDLGFSNNVVLNNSGNNFTDILILSANNATLHDLTGLRFTSGLSTMNGTLTLTLTGLGNLTQAVGSGVVVHGASAFDVGTNDLTLNQATNQLIGPVSVAAARNVTLANSTSLAVGSVASSGNLDFTGPGITLLNTVNATGSAAFHGTLDIKGDLAALGIAFTGATTLTGVTAQTIDARTAQLTIDGGLQKSGAGDLTLKGQGGIVSNGDLTVDAGSLTVAHALTTTGSVSATGVTLQSDATFSGAGNQAIDARSGAFQANGALNKTVSGDLALTGSLLDLNGAVHAVAGLQFNGPVTLASDLFAQGLTLDAIVLDGLGAQTIDAGTGKLLIQGTLQKATGSLVLSGVLGVEAQNTLTLSAGSLTVQDAATLSRNVVATTGLTFNASLALNGNVAQTVNAGTGTLLVLSDLTKTTTNALTFTGAALDLRGLVTARGALTFIGPATVARDVQSEGLTFQNNLSLANTLPQILDAGAGALTLAGTVNKATGDLLLKGATQVRSASDITVGGSLTVTDPLSFAGNVSAEGITIAGATLDGIGNQTFDTKHHAFVSNGDITKSSAGALTLHGSDGSSLALNGSIAAAGSLVLNGPSISLSGNAVAKGLTLLGTTLLTGASDQTLDAGAGVLLTDTIAITKPTGSLIVAGASGQLGSLTVGSEIVDNLLVSTLSGTWTATGVRFAHDLALLNDTTFNGHVSLGSGLDTASHALTFNGPVSLTQAITVTAGTGTTTYNDAIDGAAALTFVIGSGGKVALNGSVGSAIPLTRLASQGSGQLLVGSGITTSGNTQSYDTAVVLKGNAIFTELDAAGSIQFNNALDSLTSGAWGITVHSQGAVRFDAPVGAQGALAYLLTDSGGTTVLAGGSVVTQGAQIYDDAVRLERTTHLNTSGADLSFEAVDGNGQNLVLESGIARGQVGFHGGLTNLGSGVGAALTIADKLTGTVDFAGPVTANSGLSSSASSSVVFHRDVTLANGDTGTQLLGAVRLDNASFRGFDGLTFGALSLSGGPVTVASTDGQTVAFTGPIDGHQALTVNTAGMTRFDGSVGANTPLLGLTTDAAGTTQLNGNVHTTGDQLFHDTVVLAGRGGQALRADEGALLFEKTLDKSIAGDVIFQAANAVTLGADTTSKNAALSFDAPLIQAQGNVTAPGLTFTHALALTGTAEQSLDAQTGALSVASVDKAVGALTLNGTSATLDGDIATSGANLTLTLNTFRLTRDLSLTTGNGTSTLHLEGAGTGAHTLKLEADRGKIEVKGSLGSTENSLTQLTAHASTLSLGDVFTTGDQTYRFDVTGQLVLTGTTYQSSRGSIDLNNTETPRTEVPTIATIAKSDPGNLTISAAENLTMGLYEKLSEAGGDLTLRAGDTATLSDLSVANALEVDAGFITLLTRRQGSVRVVGGGETLDLGLDFVARSIAFHGLDGNPISPARIGIRQNGTERNFKVRFATEENKASVPLLPGFSFYILPGSYIDNQLIKDDLFIDSGGVYLDLRAIGFNRANVGSALPPVLPNQPEAVRTVFELSAALRDDLVKFGIFARPDKELLLAPPDSSAPIYDAVIKEEDRSPERFRVADSRISGPEALIALRLYRAIFEERTADGRVRSRLNTIQTLLTTAFNDYRATSGLKDPRGYRRYIEAQSGPALTCLNQLRDLLHQIGRLGLTANEFSISKTYVLRSIRVPGLPLKALREAVETGNPSTTETLHSSLAYEGRP